MKKVKRIVVGILVFVFIFQLFPSNILGLRLTAHAENENDVPASPAGIANIEPEPATTPEDITDVDTAPPLSLEGDTALATKAASSAGTISFAAVGGNITFDPATGTITSADKTIVSVDIPEQIDNVTVLSIANNAFINCSVLNSVTLPGTLTTIGYQAFLNCTALTSVTIPASVNKTGSYDNYGMDQYSGRWFSGCSNLTQITLENGMTVIPAGAFAYIPTSFSITIPDSITAIGSYAFRNTGIIGIDMATGSQTNSPGVLAIPASVVSVGTNVFQNCTNLTSVSWPECLPAIPNNAFDNCSALNSVTLPGTLTTIGYQAFLNCTALTSVTIPASVNKTGSYDNYGMDQYSGRWFSGCSNLTQITLENGMTVIPAGAFAYIPTGFSITIPDSITSIGSYAFGNTGIIGIVMATGSQTNSPGVLAIPASVVSVGTNVFQNCTNLLSVSWPDTLPKIPDYTFQNCTSLIRAVLPTTLTAIGYKAFDNCPKLGGYFGASVQYLSTPVTSLTETPTRITLVGNPSTYYAELYCSWDNATWFLKGSANITIASGALSGYADITNCIFLTGNLYSKVVVYNSQGGTKIGEYEKTGTDVVTSGIIEEFEWYAFSDTIAGITYEGYISEIGSTSETLDTPVYVISIRSDEAIWREYKLENEVWSATGVTYESDPIQSTSNGCSLTASNITIDDSSSTMTYGVLPAVPGYNWLLTMEKKVAIFRILFDQRMALNLNELNTSERNMVELGLKCSIDDNMFYGFFQWINTLQPHNDDYYFLKAKCFGDAVFYAYYMVRYMGSTASAANAMTTSGTASLVGLATAETGVGFVLGEGTALVALVEAAAMEVSAVTSRIRANTSLTLANRDLNYLVRTTGYKIQGITDADAIANGKTDVLPTQAISQGRPTWRQSEIDYSAQVPTMRPQISFLNREEVSYGTQGSVRPDFIKQGLSIDVKNYNITTTTGRTNLANNIYSQYVNRLTHFGMSTVNRTEKIRC